MTHDFTAPIKYLKSVGGYHSIETFDENFGADTRAALVGHKIATEVKSHGHDFLVLKPQPISERESAMEDAIMNIKAIGNNHLPAEKAARYAAIKAIDTAQEFFAIPHVGRSAHRVFFRLQRNVDFRNNKSLVA